MNAASCSGERVPRPAVERERAEDERDLEHVLDEWRFGSPLAWYWPQSQSENGRVAAELVAEGAVEEDARRRAAGGSRAGARRTRRRPRRARRRRTAAGSDCRAHPGSPTRAAAGASGANFVERRERREGAAQRPAR